MIMRALIVALSLFLATAALACPGKDDCDCDHKKTAAPAPADGQTVVLDVKGMTCGACAAKITTALKGTDGVRDCQVDLERGKATVTVEKGGRLDAEALAKVVRGLGYQATVTN